MRLSDEEIHMMPQKQHLPSVSDKEQRMYEHIKESELKEGRPTKRAKAIAAATVIKHHNAKRHAKKQVETRRSATAKEPSDSNPHYARTRVREERTDL